MENIIQVKFNSEQEYRDYEALNYSKISQFEKDKSQLLKPRKQTDYFTFGSYFEARCKDLVYATSTCASDYYIIDSKPDRRTKAGKAAHDEIIVESAGREIITRDDEYLASLLAENMVSMPIVIHDDNGNVELSMNVGDIMGNSTTDKYIVWTTNHNGEIITKKALLDMELNTEDKVYQFDWKSTHESIYYFHKAIEKYLYSYQDCHYSEGTSVAHQGKEVHPMIFLVASKSDKMCRPWTVHKDDRKTVRDNYLNSITNLLQWEMDGMPLDGYVEDMGIARIYG